MTWGVMLIGLMAQIPLASLAVGAWSIPTTMAAILHAGETVVPASFASGVRSSFGGDGAGGGGVTVNVNWTNYGRTSAQEIADNARLFAKHVAKQFEDNPSLRPNF